jgi:hypothetical protein
MEVTQACSAVARPDPSEDRRERIPHHVAHPTRPGPGGPPAPPATGGPPPDDVRDEELLAATEAALTSLALDHGRLFRRYRRAFFEQEGRWPGAAEVLASQARAGSFRVRKWALFHADHDPVVARALRLYLARTSRSSRPLR